MSFASGFNSGLNLTAQLRADSRARRQEKRQADLDAKAETRAKVQDEIASLRVQSLTQQMKNEQLVREETLKQREMSKIFLGEFNQKAKELDPDDLEGYLRLYGDYQSVITDPGIMDSFRNMHSVRQEIYTERKGNMGVMRKEAREKKFVNLADKAESRGIFLDPADPNDADKIMEFGRWDSINTMLEKGNLTWDQIGMEGTTFSMTVEDYGKAEQGVQKLLGQREEMNMLSPKERQMSKSGKAVREAPGGNIYEKLARSSGGIRDLNAADVQAINDSMMAMDLLEDSQVNMEMLGFKTGRLWGEVAGKIMRLAGQDQDIAAFESGIQRLIPKLARGVYGEVGVLTDADLENYRKTVASLGQSPEANELVLAETQALIARAMRNKLEELAETGYNVSQYGARLKQYKKAPTKIYRSAKQSQENLYQDVKSNRIRPGETFYVWLGDGFKVGQAGTLESYDKAAKANGN